MATKVVAKAKEVGGEIVAFAKAVPGVLKNFAVDMKNQFQNFGLNTTEFKLVIKVPLTPSQPAAQTGVPQIVDEEQSKGAAAVQPVRQQPAARSSRSRIRR